MLTLSGTPKMADFGEATEALRSANGAMTPGPGSQLYMPPEMLGENYTNSVDIYGFVAQSSLLCAD